MNDEFYRAFEERYRGTRDLIIARLAVYRPFIAPLKAIYPTGNALDLGCGRGEWLELLLKEGFSPLGIDRDAGMLRECFDRSLPVLQGDATTYLASVADDSQAVVTAFHVVEHLPFDQLRALVSEALRVLKPGGLLIMETPNPENILVATSNFYLDPTHKRPIPPQLLSFLPEYYGFFRTKILRLQESKVFLENDAISLQNVLEGVSPDYAVIAQKAASPEINELFDKLFQQESGLSLNTLATGFDRRLQRYEVMALRATECASEAESAAQHSVQSLHAIYASYSWRITAPLRWIGSKMRSFCIRIPSSHVFQAVKTRIISPLLAMSIGFVLNRPRLKAYLQDRIRRHPSIEARLFRFAAHKGIIGHPISPPTPVAPRMPSTAPSDVSQETLRVYNDLSEAIRRHHQRKP